MVSFGPERQEVGLLSPSILSPATPKLSLVRKHWPDHINTPELLSTAHVGGSVYHAKWTRHVQVSAGYVLIREQMNQRPFPRLLVGKIQSDNSSDIRVLLGSQGADVAALRFMQANANMADGFAGNPHSSRWISTLTRRGTFL